MTNEYIPSYEVAKNWYAHESETLELEFDRFVRKVRADERERVIREIRMIPCWAPKGDPDGGEFDLDILAHRPFVLATIRGMSDD